MQKITVKDMMNRYIVSGLVVLAVFAREHNYDPVLVKRIEEEN